MNVCRGDMSLIQLQDRQTDRQIETETEKQRQRQRQRQTDR